MSNAILQATEGMMANLMQLMVQEVVERQKQQQALEAQRAAWWAVRLSKDKNNKLYFAPAPPEEDKITLDFIVQVIINVINFQHCIVPLEETLTSLGITISKYSSPILIHELYSHLNTIISLITCHFWICSTTFSLSSTNVLHSGEFSGTYQHEDVRGEH